MICTVIWCLLRQRNGGLNSGPKSANIVTDAYTEPFVSCLGSIVYINPVTKKDCLKILDEICYFHNSLMTMICCFYNRRVHFFIL